MLQCSSSQVQLQKCTPFLSNCHPFLTINLNSLTRISAVGFNINRYSIPSSSIFSNLLNLQISKALKFIIFFYLHSTNIFFRNSTYLLASSHSSKPNLNHPWTSLWRDFWSHFWDSKTFFLLFVSLIFMFIKLYELVSSFDLKFPFELLNFLFAYLYFTNLGTSIF